MYCMGVDCVAFSADCVCCQDQVQHILYSTVDTYTMNVQRIRTYMCPSMIGDILSTKLGKTCLWIAVMNPYLIMYVASLD